MRIARKLTIAVTAAFASCLVPSGLEAKVVTKTISYKDGDAALQGFLAYDDAAAGKRPGILVVHEWWGLNDYARKRAEMLAELGYVAFALDMYGEGKTTSHPSEAGEWAGIIRKNVDAWRKRALAGLEVLKSQPNVDATRLAAMGYCFGGSTSIQLAYANCGLKGVVSFHGALPAYAGTEKIAAKILVCHGADDSFIPQEQIDAFRKSLDAAGADWHMVSYGGARHSFTNPGADKAGLDGLRYNKAADERSWAHMKRFLAEVFES